MSRFLEIAILSLGGLCLFAVSFLGFALSAGVPMREVAVVGALFDEGEQPDAAPKPVAEHSAPPPVRTDAEVVQNHLALLSLWSLDSPFAADELSSLVHSVKARSDELERRLGDVEKREDDLSGRRDSLSEQHETLEEIRAELEAYDAQLRLRESEVRRDENASKSAEAEQWAETARLFQDGDAGTLAPRLQQFNPDEAARILRSLDDVRARELLDALPDAQWKTYAAAYTGSRP